MHVTCETWPRAKLPPDFSGVAEGLAGVLQLKDMMSPRGVATRTCDASGENETEGGGGYDGLGWGRREQLWGSKYDAWYAGYAGIEWFYESEHAQPSVGRGWECGVYGCRCVWRDGGRDGG